MEIPTLKIEVDSSSVERATAAFDALTLSVVRAKIALDKFKSEQVQPAPVIVANISFTPFRDQESKHLGPLELGELIGKRVREVLLRERRPGGLLAPQEQKP